MAKITRELLKRGVNFWESGGSGGSNERRVISLLNYMGIEVEPEPLLPDVLLPDVTRGELVIDDTVRNYIRLRVKDGNVLYWRGCADCGNFEGLTKAEIMANVKLHAVALPLAKAASELLDAMDECGGKTSIKLCEKCDKLLSVLREAGANI